MECSIGIDESYGPFVDLARTFSRKAVLPMFEGDFPDGDLSLVPSILDKAFEVGLASSPAQSMPGYEYGIWGTALAEAGAGLSATLLSEVAGVCAGVAMNLHAQGLASLVATFSKKDIDPCPVRVAAALQEGYGLPGYRTLKDPACEGPEAVTTSARPNGGGYVVSGRKVFVYGMAGIDAFVVFCRLAQGDGGWGCFLVPASSPGLSVSEVRGRTGIRACGLWDLVLQDVEVPGHARLDDGDASLLVGRAVCVHWLGLSAIALGNARGAVLAAKRYAAERYQGGAIIENLPAVQKLIALSEARVETAQAVTSQAASSLRGASCPLRQCAIARRMASDLSFLAVTDSLQVFGGYGFIEDFRMEKRLRDAAVLKSVGGPGNSLELFIFEAGKEA